MTGNERLQFGEFVVEPSLQRLTLSGSVVPLKPKAYDLLCLLLTNRERVLSKEELIDWLWPRQEIGESNLSQTVYELRRALGESAQEPKWIETVPRRGYRFCGAVNTAEAAEPGSAPGSIAVMPFMQLGEGGVQDYLILGIADALITSLSGSRRLVVRPLSAVLRYAGRYNDVLEAASELNVETVLEGSCQVGPAGLRVSGRLLRVPDGTCLETFQFTVSGNDPFEIEDQVCGRIAQTVASRLSDSGELRRSSQHTGDPEVHIACMKGRHCWHKWTLDAWLEAVRHFQHALQRQPDHAPSLAGLAAAWSTLGIFGACPPREAFAAARDAAQRAVTLDPESPQGHEIMGAIHLFHDWDLSAAAATLDRAIELAPDSCNARHLRALTLAAGGSDSPSLAEINRALQCDPQSLITLTDLGYIHFWYRRHEEAEGVCREVLARDPSFAHARQALSVVLAELGEIESALVQLEKAIADFGRDPALSGEMACLLGRAGRRDEAARIMDRLESLSRQDYIDPFQLVLAGLGLGDQDRAFKWLDTALNNRSRDLMLMNIHPVMDPLRRDPRFAEFLKRAGLEWPVSRQESAAATLRSSSDSRK